MILAEAVRRYAGSGARLTDGRSRLVLPDFYTGAHAQLLGAILLTRDKRFEKAFPDVTVVPPPRTSQS